jgi:hypothetical protein
LSAPPVHSRGEFDRRGYWLLTIHAWAEAFGIDLRTPIAIASRDMPSEALG